VGRVGGRLVRRLGVAPWLLARRLQARPVVAHGLLPQRVQRRGVGRPRRVLAVVLEAVAAGELEDVLLEQAARVVDALVHAFAVGREDRVGRGEPAGLGRLRSSMICCGAI